MNLDIAIIALLKEYTGKVSRSKMWEHFDNYSKGYLSERLYALKRSGWMIESEGIYILTEKGWAVKLD